MKEKIGAENRSLEIVFPVLQNLESEFKIVIAGNPDIVSGAVHELKNERAVVELSFEGPLDQIAAVDEQSVLLSFSGNVIPNRFGKFQKIGVFPVGKDMPVYIGGGINVKRLRGKTEGHKQQKKCGTEHVHEWLSFLVFRFGEQMGRMMVKEAPVGIRSYWIQPPCSSETP